MTPSLLLAASDPSPWIGPAIIAAAVSGVVALATVALNNRRGRKDRQRQLFADAFAACQAYKEFPYKVRRRRSDDEAAADRSRLTGELSELQNRLNELKARLRLEAPRTGQAFGDLVSETRRIAGEEVRRSWSLPALEGDDVNITDIDLTALEPVEDRYLLATADHLSAWPGLALRIGRGVFQWFRSARVRGR